MSENGDYDAYDYCDPVANQILHMQRLFNSVTFNIMKTI